MVVNPKAEHTERFKKFARRQRRMDLFGKASVLAVFSGLNYWWVYSRWDFHWNWAEKSVTHKTMPKGGRWYFGDDFSAEESPPLQKRSMVGIESARQGS